jgi:hypothetical protein
MAYSPTAKELQSVPLLDGAKRYEYCVKKVADQEAIWSLAGEDGWVLAGDDEGRVHVPIWPHEKFASLCANGGWSGCRPRPIDLDAWLERWTPGMERDQRMVAVFPTPGHRGVVVDPQRFADDLSEELSQYE